jgi:hypothetical protein
MARLAPLQRPRGKRGGIGQDRLLQGAKAAAKLVGPQVERFLDGPSLQLPDPLTQLGPQLVKVAGDLRRHGHDDDSSHGGGAEATVKIARRDGQPRARSQPATGASTEESRSATRAVTITGRSQ